MVAGTSGTKDHAVPAVATPRVRLTPNDPGPSAGRDPKG